MADKINGAVRISKTRKPPKTNTGNKFGIVGSSVNSKSAVTQRKPKRAQPRIPKD